MVLGVNGDKSPPSCTKPYDKMTACNLICNMIHDSDATSAMKMLQTKMESLTLVIDNKPSSPQPAVPVSSCKQQYEKYKWNKSQVLPLQFGSQEIPVYCHMGNFGCGDGGWTLAMKIDGNKKTFHYDSKLWGDRNAYNLAGGKTGFDSQETKMPSYWTLPVDSNTCGDVAQHSPDNGDKDIKAMGYILVQ